MIADAAETNSFTQWTSVPAICNFELVMIVNPTPSDPGLILFDEVSRTVTVSATSVYYNGILSPNVYSVEIRAWGDNDYDTNEFITLDVTVINPCIDPTLSWILIPASPLTTQTYYVGSGYQTYNV